MSKTVSARLPNETHKELVNRCNKLGCTVNDFLSESLKMCLYSSSNFDFDDEESVKEPIKILDLSKENKEIPQVRITKVSHDGGKTWINYE